VVPTEHKSAAAWLQRRKWTRAKCSARKKRQEERESPSPEAPQGRAPGKRQPRSPRPCPPRKFSQIGKQCPSSAANAAIIIQVALSLLIRAASQTGAAPFATSNSNVSIAGTVRRHAPRWLRQYCRCPICARRRRQTPWRTPSQTESNRAGTRRRECSKAPEKSWTCAAKPRPSRR